MLPSGREGRLLRNRVRNELARRGLALAGRARPSGRVPFREVACLSRLAFSPDTLVTWRRARKVVVPLTDERLATAVGDLIQDGYAIDTEALALLDQRVTQARPQAILEFGSGMSTVVLAARMALLQGEEGTPHVFSIDEDSGYLERTRRMLDVAGLTGRVRLAHRPLRRQTVLGRETRCYDLDDSFIRGFLTVEPDFLLIDGPSGGGDVRYGTLPLVASHLSRPCRLFLDDALREDELRLVSLWRRLPALRVRGVYLVGDGLLEAVWS